MVTENAIEMFVGGLMLDPNTQAPVVVLKDESGEIVLPIWIGVAEATSIASAIKQLPMARPLTHDLMLSMCNEVGLKVERIVITELKESTYYAEMVLTVGEKAIIFDARPSDAIALAVRASAPIYVTQQVLDQARIAFGQTEAGSASGQQASSKAGAEGDEGEQGPGAPNLANIDKDKWNEILDNLDPDDFKYKM